MELGNHTVLVTGGASGIGFAMAERFLKAGSTVIICGRRADKLKEAQSKCSGFHTRVCDVSKPSERQELVKWVTNQFPKLNVLVNNAGIQRRIDFSKQPENWSEVSEEIAINLEAPIHLCQLILPHFLQQNASSIINVSSGLAFVPLSFHPVYCATKAALHSFTLSLRQQLEDTSVRVIEVIPPAVNTDLGGPGKHTFGVPLNDFADATMKLISENKIEFGYQFSETVRLASRNELDKISIQLHNTVRQNRPDI